MGATFDYTPVSTVISLIPKTGLLHVNCYIRMGRDSVVSIVTRYGLDGPGIESQRGRDFPHPSRPAMRPTQPPIQRIPGLFPGVKRPGRGVSYPPPSRAEVKERVEPIPLLHLWAFMACSRVNFTLTLPY